MWRTSVAVVLLGFCMAAVAAIGWLVLRQIDDLSTSNSDNLQYTLSRVDVEFLQFEFAMLEAQQDPALLSGVRRRFDVFYSRLNTLRTGTVYQPLRDDPTISASMDRVGTFLDETVGVIDQPDQLLLAALPDLVQRAGVASPQVRAMSLAGLASFAELADKRRHDVMLTLSRMAVVLAVLLGGLSVLALSFHRLYRLSERRARDLHQAGARTRTIVETSDDAIILCNSAGLIVDLNDAAVTLFGHSRTAATGSPIIDLCFDPEIRADLLAGALGFVAQGRRPQADERRLVSTAINSDGRTFPAEIFMDRGEDDGAAVYVAFIRDISDRQAAEVALTEARDRALAGQKAKADFIAVMSHEMRTPLNGLLGTAQLMRDLDLNDRQSALLDRMTYSGELLLGLVNDVLDLAKFEAGKLIVENRPMTIPNLLDGVVETTASLAARNGNSLAWHWVGAPAGMVMGDCRRLRQVLLNLVGNAVKFTQAGSIMIEAECLVDRADQVEFRVIDTGAGIAAKDLDRIFSDFETLDSSYSRKAGGTGLGLGIARRLVTLMGGEIAAESVLGQGSTFRLRVPMAAVVSEPDSARQITAPAFAQTRQVRPLSVLVVEDNEINRFVAREMLLTEGHRVTEAFDGLGGVKAAEAERFDVILMDISMPVMDGQQAARAIRAGNGASARVPIIAVSAHALPEEMASFRAAGMDDCIAKPINRQALNAALSGVGRMQPQSSVVEFSHAEDATTDSGLIDHEQLVALRDAVSREDLADLIARFLDEGDASIPQLAAYDPDAPGLDRAAHKLAGSTATFGLLVLRRALGAIEAGAASGRVSVNDLAGLVPLWQRSRAALLHWQDQ